MSVPFHGKEFKEYCALLELGNIVAACMFPHLDNPRHYEAPRRMFSGDVFLGFEKHDRSSEIHRSSNLPDRLKGTLALEDQTICQDAKQQIGMAFVLDSLSPSVLRSVPPGVLRSLSPGSDLRIGKEIFEISEELDGPCL